MITKCMLRIGGGPISTTNGEANLGGSEFSDSSSSVSIEDLPPSAFSAHSPGGLLTVVTPHSGSNSLTNTLLADEATASMVTLMEASDCDDITGFNFDTNLSFPSLFSLQSATSILSFSQCSHKTFQLMHTAQWVDFCILGHFILKL